MSCLQCCVSHSQGHLKDRTVFRANSADKELTFACVIHVLDASQTSRDPRPIDERLVDMIQPDGNCGLFAVPWRIWIDCLSLSFTAGLNREVLALHRVAEFSVRV